MKEEDDEGNAGNNEYTCEYCGESGDRHWFITHAHPSVEANEEPEG
jgi:hypothetical protein